MIIDLHTHSTNSDGSLTPEELVDKAMGAKVELLALCDHDTVGDDRFLSYASEKGLKAIQGIEISCEWERCTCHILGLGVEQDNEPLNEMLKKIIDSRDNRNEQTIERLNSIDIDITIEEVLEVAGEGTVGRPHIAKVLIDKGYVETTQEAFDKYLDKSKIGYVRRYRPEPEEAIKMLKAAGAKPVLAHPTQLKRTLQDFDIIFGQFKEYGLWGVEVYTPYTPLNLIGALKALCYRHELGYTAGSDFHGDPKPSHFLGELTNGIKIKDRYTNLEL